MPLRAQEPENAVALDHRSTAVGGLVGHLRSVRAALAFWLMTYRRTWRGSAASGFLAPVLYLGSLGYGLGSLIDRGTAAAGAGLGGVAYAAFVAPGVLTATAMQTAVTESTYPVMGAVKWNRQYHAMLATPLEPVHILLGHLAFVVVRVALVSLTFAGVGLAFGAFGIGVLPAVGVAVLCGAAHAAPVMAFSVRQDTESGFPLLFRFGLVPMFLFAGTFFPLTQLPAAIRPLAWVTPLWHATDLARGLCLGSLHPGLHDLLWSGMHLAYLLLWCVGGCALATRGYRARLAP